MSPVSDSQSGFVLEFQQMPPCAVLSQKLTTQGKVSPRKSVGQSACQYDVSSRASDFQNGEQKVFIERTDKNFELITELFRFLGF